MRRELEGARHSLPYILFSCPSQNESFWPMSGAPAGQIIFCSSAALLSILQNFNVTFAFRTAISFQRSGTLMMEKESGSIA